MDTLKVDTYCIEKFGEEYKQYMKRVPKLNFLLGVYRKIEHKKKLKTISHT
jgi:hypothetical protein